MFGVGIIETVGIALIVFTLLSIWFFATQIKTPLNFASHVFSSVAQQKIDENDPQTHHFISALYTLHYLRKTRFVVVLIQALLNIGANTWIVANSGAPWFIELCVAVLTAELGVMFYETVRQNVRLNNHVKNMYVTNTNN